MNTIIILIILGYSICGTIVVLPIIFLIGAYSTRGNNLKEILKETPIPKNVYQYGDSYSGIRDSTRRFYILIGMIGNSICVDENGNSLMTTTYPEEEILKALNRIEKLLEK